MRRRSPLFYGEGADQNTAATLVIPVTIISCFPEVSRTWRRCRDGSNPVWSAAADFEGVGLPSRAPPIAPARPHPQDELDFAA